MDLENDLIAAFAPLFPSVVGSCGALAVDMGQFERLVGVLRARLEESVRSERVRLMGRLGGDCDSAGPVPVALTEAEWSALLSASAAYCVRMVDGVGLGNDGPARCGEISQALVGLLSRLSEGGTR